LSLGVANGCVYIGTQGAVGAGPGGNGNAGMFYIYGIAGQSPACQ